MAYYLKDLPFTEEGKKLNLSDEDKERFRLVYKKEGEDWILHGILGEGGEYGDDCIVVPLESAYRGYQYLDPGEEFENVVGSVGDRIPWSISSWINLWRCVYTIVNNVIPPKICCTDGMKYSEYDIYGALIHMDSYIPMNPDKLVGGHVVLRNNLNNPGSREIVYIVPICSMHNGMKANGYMKIGYHRTFAVQLFYRAEQLVYNYLAQHPLETHEKI